MPISAFLATLSRAARRAFPIIRRGVREGVSANRIQRLLQDHGLGIRRTNLLEIVRRERGVAAAGERLRFIPKGLRPDPSRLPEALTRLLRRFSFTVRIRGSDPRTGETLERFVNVASDEVLTRGELEAQGEAFVEGAAERYQIQAPEFLLVGGVRAGEPGVLL